MTTNCIDNIGNRQELPVHNIVTITYPERPVVSGGFRPFGEDHYDEIHTRNRPSELNSGTPLHKKHVSGPPIALVISGLSHCH